MMSLSFFGITVLLSQSFVLSFPYQHNKQQSTKSFMSKQPNGSRDEACAVFGGDRRSLFSATAASLGAMTSVTAFPQNAQATITKESNWPLWTALPVAPFNRRRTIRYEVGPGAFSFDQLIGIYYVRKYCFKKEVIEACMFENL
jgi:hypothetical protein